MCRGIVISYTSLVAQTVKRLLAMQETRVRPLGREDPLEKEMAMHSSTLAWKIPWTEEPGHFLLQCMKVKRASEVAQSCPTLFDPTDCSLPGSSVHGIFQARVLEWVAISFSRGSSQPRGRTQVSCTASRRFTV